MYKLPTIGFGLYQLEDEKQLRQALEDAIEVGYRFFDTARLYGNERILGEVLRASKLKREEYQISTKVWLDMTTENLASESLFRSLEDLKLDYLDIALIHQPYNDYYGAWRAMKRLKTQGFIKHLGVSNFSEQRLADFIHHQAEEDRPLLNQLECHIYYQRSKERSFMQKNGIQTQAWGALARLRGNLLNDDSLAKLASDLQLDIPSLCLAYLSQLEISLLVTSANKKHLLNNYRATTLKLPREIMTQLSLFDRGQSLFSEDGSAERFFSLAKRTTL